MTNTNNAALIDIIITEIDDLIWVDDRRDDRRAHNDSYFTAISTYLSGIDGIYEGSDY